MTIEARPADEPQQARREHPAKPLQGDDEDYVDYLGRCADHWTSNPPAAPDGFELIPCDATPRHWPKYTPIDDDFYPANCPDCAYASLADAHRGCEHSHHRAWRRWRITGKLAGWLYVTGITASGGGWQMGGGCPGCYTMPKWNRNKRVYILGLRRETWHCLLKRRHVSTVDQSFGLCTKCCPCPTCGSKEVGHQWGCEVSA